MKLKHLIYLVMVLFAIPFIGVDSGEVFSQDCSRVPTACPPPPDDGGDDPEDEDDPTDTPNDDPCIAQGEDQDGDGICDSEDDCPETSGNLPNGCPDEDDPSDDPCGSPTTGYDDVYVQEACPEDEETDTSGNGPDETSENPDLEIPTLYINELTPGGLTSNPNQFYIEFAVADRNKHRVDGFTLEFYEILPNGQQVLYAQITLEGETNEDGLFLLMSEAHVVLHLSQSMPEIQVSSFSLLKDNLSLVLKDPENQVISTYNHDGQTAPEGAGQGEQAVERTLRLAPDQEGCWQLNTATNPYFVDQSGMPIYGSPLQENPDVEGGSAC